MGGRGGGVGLGGGGGSSALLRGPFLRSAKPKKNGGSRVGQPGGSRAAFGGNLWGKLVLVLFTFFSFPFKDFTTEQHVQMCRTVPPGRAPAGEAASSPDDTNFGRNSPVAVGPPVTLPFKTFHIKTFQDLSSPLLSISKDDYPNLAL